MSPAKIRRPHPDAQPAGSPSTGALYAVRYVDSRRRTVTRLFRQRPAALRYVARIEALGGTASLHRSTVGRWRRAE